MIGVMFAEDFIAASLGSGQTNTNRCQLFILPTPLFRSRRSQLFEWGNILTAYGIFGALLPGHDCPTATAPVVWSKLWLRFRRELCFKSDWIIGAMPRRRMVPGEIIMKPVSATGISPRPHGKRSCFLISRPSQLTSPRFRLGANSLLGNIFCPDCLE
jgi:hypothetical protein